TGRAASATPGGTGSAGCTPVRVRSGGAPRRPSTCCGSHSPRTRAARPGVWASIRPPSPDAARGRVIRTRGQRRRSGVTPTHLLDRMGDPPVPADYARARAAAGPPLTTEERFQLTYAAHVEWGTEGTFASL